VPFKKSRDLIGHPLQDFLSKLFFSLREPTKLQRFPVSHTFDDSKKLNIAMENFSKGDKGATS
jgi:hypothetical protein